MVSRGGSGLELVGIVVANGLALAALITALGGYSGAHFNPAVTVAALIGRQVTAVHAGLYVLTQLLAAVLAGFALRAVFPTAIWKSVNLGTPAVVEGISFGAAVLLEAVLAFILVIVIFGTAMDAPAVKAGGFAIGLTVAAAILMGGALTGAAMNPARTFGPAVAANFWENHPVHWIGPPKRRNPCRLHL